MKIGIAEFHQETNSFNPVHSILADFELFGIHEREEMIARVDKDSALKGIIDTLEDDGAKIVPTERMWAIAGGPVEGSVVDDFKRTVISILKEQLPLDGVCLSLHGATQSTDSDDVSGDLLTAIRELVGNKTVICASLDLHANITSRMMQASDCLCGYLTYPHVDFYQTGVRAAKHCLRLIKDPKSERMNRVAVPMIVPASGFTTQSGPFAALMRKGREMVDKGDLSDFSVFLMQPWLDVPSEGSSILTITPNGDNHLAIQLAEELVPIRHEMKPQLISAEEIIELSSKNDSGKPVVLVDAADSPNAGASGDSAYVLEKILSGNMPLKAAIALSDAPAAEKAFKIGVGHTADFNIGGTINTVFSKPVQVEAYVQSLHDGTYIQEGPAKRGLTHRCGKTAVLKVRDIDIIVTSHLLGPGDMQVFRHFGIEPTFYQMVVVKACTSFRAGYEPIAEKIIDAATPGAANANLPILPYQKLSRKFYPFSEIEKKDITIFNREN
ncbi:M81 family metallopeptidase [Pseudoramibacter faecis]|uniref:M81 family metallopeptidase n=1 Tax=Pseudoramibacter faecis TaxID=3108534 RepID=UPI002E78DD69|nr:M81 family metallopeptidase [Pseudoramibacter sp. HA2172]